VFTYSFYRPKRSNAVDLWSPVSLSRKFDTGTAVAVLGLESWGG